MIRNPMETDIDWIIHTWLDSWRSRFDEKIEGPYMDGDLCLRAIRAILTEARLYVSAGHPTGQPYGWMAVHKEEPWLLYAYTTLSERRRGHFTSLCAHAFGEGKKPRCVFASSPKWLRELMPETKFLPSLPWLVLLRGGYVKSSSDSIR